MKTTPFRIVMVALGTTIILSCVSQQKATQLQPTGRYTSRQPAAMYSGGYDYESFYDLSPQATMNCQDFFTLLNQADPKPSTIQAALQIIKRKKPKFFSHYVLLPNSLSIHESSPEYPRAMVYGGDGKAVITFNGDPKQRGYGHLELMCFNQSNATFEFREITFPQEAKDDMEDLTARQRTQAFVVSPVNGSRSRDCRQCHQSPARPNWDTYAVWPSSFGAIDDSLFRKEYRETFLRSGSFEQKYSEAEMANWQKFSRKGRYAVLNKNAADRPNLTAGKLFAQLNAERIVGELKRLGVQFERRKGEFAQALYCPMAGFEYKDFWIKEGMGGYGTKMNVLVPPVDPEVKKILIASGSYSDAKEHRLKSNFHLGPVQPSRYDNLQKEVEKYYLALGFSETHASFAATSNVEDIIRLAHIKRVIKPFNIDIENWSMVINGGYDYEDGSGGERGFSFAQTLDKPFLETFFPEDDVLIGLVQKRRNTNPNEIKELPQILKEESDICDHIKSRYN